MTPTDLIFQAFSNMTLGLVDDLITVIIGMVGLTMLVVAVRKIQSVLLGKRLDEAIDSRGLSDQYEKYKDRRIIQAKFRHDHSDL
jgi:hypothetical protein